jgi:hypothetical protein
MEIEKIKNYNQKILAILGSIVALMAAIGLIMLLFFAISELTRFIRYNNEDEGILSEEKIEKLQKENKRQQLISYDFPRLIDTINSIYVIPVRHQTLNVAEYIDEGVLGLMDSFEKVKSDSRYSSYYYGSFNNLIIYDMNNKTTEKLFDKRVNFGEIRTRDFEDDILVLFTAASKDTYKDGVVNLTDLKSLYIYSIKYRKLRVISDENADIAHYDFVHDNKNIIIRFGFDYNKDGKFDDDSEPSLVKRYDFKSDKIEEIVPENLNDELQKRLEGSKK